MNDQLMKKSLIAAAALLVASGKAPANPVTSAFDDATLKASAEKLGEFPADDFDQSSTDQETEILETKAAMFAADAPASYAEYNVDIVSEHGTVSLSAPGLRAENFNGKFAAGKSALVQIAPEEGYSVKYVTMTSSEGVTRLQTVNGSYLMKMPESDVTLTVEYTDDNAQNGYSSETANEYNVDVESAHGKVNLSVRGQEFTGTIQPGKSAIISVDAEEGYTVKNITAFTADGQPYALTVLNGSYVLEMPKSDITIKVEYNGEENVADTDFANVIIDGINDTYNKGETPVYTVKAADGTVLTEGTDYTVSAKSERGTGATIKHTLTFTGAGSYTGEKVISYNEVITSTATAEGHNVNINSENGTVTVSLPGTNKFGGKLEAGKTAILQIKANDGYAVESVKVVTAQGENELTSANGSYLFKMPDSDVTINVNYKNVGGATEQDETSAHAINVVSANGGVFVSNAKTSEAIKSAAKGDIVNLMVKPAANYTVESVTGD